MGYIALHNDEILYYATNSQMLDDSLKILHKMAKIRVMTDWLWRSDEF